MYVFYIIIIFFFYEFRVLAERTRKKKDKIIKLQTRRKPILSHHPHQGASRVSGRPTFCRRIVLLYGLLLLFCVPTFPPYKIALICLYTATGYRYNNIIRANADGRVDSGLPAAVARRSVLSLCPPIALPSPVAN